jgi:predicted acylesterase/phospholipase RssA
VGHDHKPAPNAEVEPNPQPALHADVEPNPQPAPHEVLRALAARVDAGSLPGARDDGLRIALVIEGGGMRGILSGGMALTVAELGLVPAFDAIYGASAGAITGAWLLSRPEGLLGWPEPAYVRVLIRRTAWLRGRPVADVRALIEDLYQTTFPLDFAAVLANPVELHPLATDAATGQPTDLYPFIGNPVELRLALRASAALPLLAGPPVEFAGRRFYDGGVSESVPYRTALAQGATHLLILRSRRAPRALPDAHHASPQPDAPRPSRSARPPQPDAHHASPQPDAHRPSRSARLLARTTLRRETPALRAAFLGRESRLAADDQTLAEHEAASRIPPASPVSPASPVTSASPAVLSIRPPADAPVVSRMATDGTLLRAALEAGRAAARAVFDSRMITKTFESGETENPSRS